MIGKKEIIQRKLALELPISAKLLTTPEVAQLLRISEWTLKRWRKQEKGPPFTKLGRRIVRYPRRGLMCFLRMHLQGQAVRRPLE